MKKKTFIKVAKMLCDLNIVLLEQILDIKGSYLIIWQQFKMSRKKSKKGKKVIWYKEIEEKVLINEKKREVKEEYKTDMKNYLGYRIYLKKSQLIKENVSRLFMKIVIVKAGK